MKVRCLSICVFFNCFHRSLVFSLFTSLVKFLPSIFIVFDDTMNRMDLERIILSEISQRKINAIWYHLNMECHKNRELIGSYQRLGMGRCQLSVQTCDQ